MKPTFCVIIGALVVMLFNWETFGYQLPQNTTHLLDYFDIDNNRSYGITSYLHKKFTNVFPTDPPGGINIAKFVTILRLRKGEMKLRIYGREDIDEEDVFEGDTKFLRSNSVDNIILFYRPTGFINRLIHDEECTRERSHEVLDLLLEGDGTPTRSFLRLAITICVRGTSIPPYTDTNATARKGEFSTITVTGETPLGRISPLYSKISIDGLETKGDLFLYECAGINDLESRQRLTSKINQFQVINGTINFCYRSPRNESLSVSNDSFKYKFTEYVNENRTKVVLDFDKNEYPWKVANISLDSSVVARSGYSVGSISQPFDIHLEADDTESEGTGKVVNFAVLSMPAFGKLVDKKLGLEISTVPYMMQIEPDMAKVQHTISYVPEIVNAFPNKEASLISVGNETNKTIISFEFASFSDPYNALSQPRATMELRVIPSEPSDFILWEKPEHINSTKLILTDPGKYYAAPKNYFSMKPHLGNESFLVAMKVSVKNVESRDQDNLFYRFQFYQTITLNATSVSPEPIINASLYELVSFGDSMEEALQALSEDRYERQIRVPLCPVQGCNRDLWLVGLPVVLNSVLESLEILSIAPGTINPTLQVEIFNMKTEWLNNKLEHEIDKKSYPLSLQITSCGWQTNQENGCPRRVSVERDVHETAEKGILSKIILALIVFLGIMETLYFASIVSLYFIRTKRHFPDFCVTKASSSEPVKNSGKMRSCKMNYWCFKKKPSNV